MYLATLTIHSVARVKLESLLFREDVKLDARVRACQGGDRTLLSPVVGTELISVDNVASVVTSAVCTAVASKLRRTEIGANLLWRRPEVVDRVLLVWRDSAVWD